MRGERKSDGRTLGRLLLWLAILGCGDRANIRQLPIPGEGVRVTVEVLNASGRPGLARVGTRVLRQAGIDVVNFGTAATTLDSTQILVRRGEAATGERVRRALHGGKVVMQPDSTRLLDASVLLGRDFAPPRAEFHP